MASIDVQPGKPHDDPRQAEPRWPALLALLAMGALQFGLPSCLSLGPDWLLLAVVAVLVAPVIVLHRRGRHSVNQTLGYLILALITVQLIASLVLLVAGLPSHRESPATLLLSAGGLWVGNVLLFASWYWRLDGGGPHRRDARHTHEIGAFLFPQMTLSQDLKATLGVRHWRPGFVDYLFLAFNTSTAFSPTDTPVLSRWAKAMMMVQAGISLGAVAILAARAINVF
ncbi:MAG: hypothetical protein HY822_00880 [Acidobacteria bacterium]|nr:hypothetical protein [Acidobacteriota bacterium]